ncbi:hypothetical protein [Geobacter sp.]|uniref:hypothetical protein n=1 Tax=Geobacter sp. TaxID=46610 RepID=UPI00262B065F|nr:hypothetical protein [Geobacter sp.]
MVEKEENGAGQGKGPEEGDHSHPERHLFCRRGYVDIELPGQSLQGFSVVPADPLPLFGGQEQDLIAFQFLEFVPEGLYLVRPPLGRLLGPGDGGGHLRSMERRFHGTSP